MTILLRDFIQDSQLRFRKNVSIEFIPRLKNWMPEEWLPNSKHVEEDAAIRVLNPWKLWLGDSEVHVVEGQRRYRAVRQAEVNIAQNRPPVSKEMSLIREVQQLRRLKL